MLDKNLHINLQKFGNTLPETDIRVDDAWGAMKKILDKEGSGNEKIFVHHTPKRHSKKKYFILLLLLLISTTFFNLFLLRKSKKNNLDAKNKRQSENIVELNAESLTNTDGLLEEKGKKGQKQPDSPHEKNVITSSSSTDNSNNSSVKERNWNHIDSIVKNINHTAKTKQIFKNDKIPFHKIESSTVKSRRQAEKKQNLLSGVARKKYKKPNNDIFKERNSENDTRNQNNTYEDTFVIDDNNIFSRDFVNDSTTDLLKKSNEVPHVSAYDTDNINDSLNLALKRENTELHINSEFKKQKTWSHGLQMNIPIPIYGTSHYATGINGKFNLSFLYIPELWIGKNLDAANSLKLFIAPNSVNNIGSREVSKTTRFTQISPTDSAEVMSSLNILKIAGVSGSLQYNYKINSNFSFGIGIGASIYKKALGRYTINRVDNGAVLVDSMYKLTSISTDWKYIRSSGLSGKLEASYNLRRMNIGVNVHFPLNSPFLNVTSNKFTINSQLFFRWRL